MTTPRILPILLALTAPLLTTPAHAGPTAGADLDLGTSTKGAPSSGSIAPLTPTPSPLYTVGFGVRAGWRFDLGPAWLLPELGAGYSVESFQGVVAAQAPSDVSLTRFFVGGRAGWSGALAPGLFFEPAVYGHGGAGWYSSSVGSAFDVGLSLDLRIRGHFIVGAQVGYDVVTVYSSSSGGSCQPYVIETSAGPMTLACPVVATPAVADPWVSYGIHAGWLFW